VWYNGKLYHYHYHSKFIMADGQDYSYAASNPSPGGATSDSYPSAMGGVPGDGGLILSDASQPYNVYAGPATPAGGGGGGGASHFQQMQQGQGQGQASPQMYASVRNPVGGAGSVTQYANAGPMNANTNMYQPPQQQQQQQPYQNQQPPPSSPYNFSPPPQPVSGGGVGGGPGPGSMSFAQRSAMMQQQPMVGPSSFGAVGGGMVGQTGMMIPPHHQQQQQRQQPPVAQVVVPSAQQQQQQPHQPPIPSNTYGGGGGGGMSFAQRSQMMQQQQHQVPSTPANSIYTSIAGGSNAMYPPTPSTPQMQQQQHQQQVLQQPSYGYSSQQPQTPGRQPQIYSQQQQQQLQSGMNNSYMGSPPPQGGIQASPQQQTTMSQSVVGGSYAQRSVMAQSQQVGGFVAAQQQPPQQQPPQQQQQQQIMGGGGMQPPPPPPPPPTQKGLQQPNAMVDPPEVIAQQQRLLTDATRKVQEHAYYMKQAMEKNDLPTILDRAASMVGELGEHAHAHHHHHVHPPAVGATGSTTALSPKNYYELHLRALEELPTLEDYLLNLSQQPQQQQHGYTSLPLTGLNSPGMNPSFGTPSSVAPTPPGTPMGNGNDPLMMGAMPVHGATNLGGMMQQQQQMMMGQQPQYQPQYQQQPQFSQGPVPKISYTMKELYDCVQYCPNVLSRLYLQICAASALIRSGEVGARWVLKDTIEAVKCVQNPVRGLFLRHYLLQAFRDKLPDGIIPVEEIGVPLTRRVVAPSGEYTNPIDNVSTPGSISSKVAMTSDAGTVKDSYEFILANFIEMNKLWVRIQHLPGDQKSKDVRRRREKDRNELRILVGTNLVRLSSLDSITSTIYGQVILPTVLDHIVICADPLAQAYLIDCIVQVFPDEYHIETMPILLGVCPKLRDKVNIRTILQSLMDRLANYLADEELLDEKDSNQVKRSVALDSFRMFDECVQTVYNSRGPKLNAKEVIRLQTALLSFSMKCYQGNLDQVTLCLKNCVMALQQARDNVALMHEANSNWPPQYQQQQHQGPIPLAQALDLASTDELEKLLSIPLEELALGVLRLDYYSDLISFLPWDNRRQVALTMLKSVSNAGKSPGSVKEIEELFSVIAPVLRGENDAPPASQQEMSDGMERTANLMAGLGVSPQPQRYLSQSFYDGNSGPASYQHDAALVSKLIDMLDHPDTDILYDMLVVARNHLNAGKRERVGTAYVALVVASLKLARRIFHEEHQPVVTTDPDSLEEKVEETNEERSENEKQETAEEIPEVDVATVEDVDDDGKKESPSPVEGIVDEGKESEAVVEEEKPKTPKVVT
jgi:hypothetical protein